MYLATFGEARGGGAFLENRQKPYRISRSSRTFVPYRVMEFDSESQVKIARDEPVIA